MKLEGKTSMDEGYLLIECLVTLSVISAILFLMYPLLVDWIVLQESTSNEVELSRTLYEESFNWPSKTYMDRNYRVVKNNQKLFIYSDEKVLGIEIYEKQFE